ncbi:MAG: vgrg protein [Clostridiales bacterium]|uniref:VgrG-related protein n=1 Tax=Clostridium sp. N3C TaxID=1776758 RepID=UPI00092DED88|nr:hypothetical protein [Clostridium sp. N3C]NLZ48049.1 vgrg protein [Clostridiales bacterium]SCN22220.1 hypothetical protein N3C_0650 [Clostridium sp. N3C]
MDNTSLQVSYLTQLLSSGLSNNKVNSAVEAEKQLAIIAFQKIYEMMIEGSSTSSSSLMSTLLLSQISGDNDIDLGSSLDLLGSLNMSSRGYVQNNYGSTKSNVTYIDSKDLGALSAKYESNGRPGVIANNPGDYGGKSYGAWQFSSKTGSLTSFINYLKNSNYDYYNTLVQAKAMDGNSYGMNFDKAWQSIAKNDSAGFLALQYNYVKSAFYDEAAKKLKNTYNFDINRRSNALKNVLWSTAVQHGVSGAVNLFSKVDLNSSDENIINGIYNERQKVNIYFRSSSADVRKSVYNRFNREREEALGMLKNERIV